MSDSKQFPIAIVLSLTSGYLLVHGGFGDMHELSEHVAGHPIWTHEFAENALWERLRNQIFDERPQLREAEDFCPPDSKKDRAAFERYLSDYVQRARERFGETISIKKGSSDRKESPMASLSRMFPDKPAIVVVRD